MASVTGRIKEIKQPRGGYLNPASFKVIERQDDKVLREENIAASIVGLVVDYMTRFLMGAEKEGAFSISIHGANISTDIFGYKDGKAVMRKLLSGINGFDNESIVNACKIVTFDVWYRNPGVAREGSYLDINPDKDTVENIKILINRSLSFFNDFGPITVDGFSFEPINGNKSNYEKMILDRKGSYGGYTATVSTGDGDFLTEDTLWDFKVSKSNPTSAHTLQLLMYWIMGMHSGNPIFKNISKIGIFNPRLNKVYLYELENVSKNIIEEIEKNVICY